MRSTASSSAPLAEKLGKIAGAFAGMMTDVLFLVGINALFAYLLPMIIGVSAIQAQFIAVAFVLHVLTAAAKLRRRAMKEEIVQELRSSKPNNGITKSDPSGKTEYASP